MMRIGRARTKGHILLPLLFEDQTLSRGPLPRTGKDSLQLIRLNRKTT